MAINPIQNSQILGSSVLVVSFLDEQDFKLYPLKGSGTAIRCFRLKHCSVYILRSEDDLKWKHGAEFPTWKDGGTGRQNPNNIRVAVCYRWLGRRCKAFGSEYQGVRRYMEVWENPNEHIQQKYPGCEKSRNMFKVVKGQGTDYLEE